MREATDARIRSIINALDDGASQVDVAAGHGVSQPYVARVWNTAEWLRGNRPFRKSYRMQEASVRRVLELSGE